MTNNLKPILPPVWKRFSKEEFAAIIEKHCGIITSICNEVDCNFKQFYLAIDHYKLRDFLAEQKKKLVSVAENAVLECLKSENEAVKMRAAEFCLKCQGKQYGWNTEPQVQI